MFRSVLVGEKIWKTKENETSSETTVDNSPSTPTVSSEPPVVVEEQEEPPSNVLPSHLSLGVEATSSLPKHDSMTEFENELEELRHLIPILSLRLKTKYTA